MLENSRICVEVGIPSNYRAKTVKALPVRIKGFEFLALFMYQNDGTFKPKGLEAQECEGKWMVSEKKTGFYVGGLSDSPEEAYYQTKERFESLGIEKVRGTLQSAIRSKAGLLSLAKRR